MFNYYYYVISILIREIYNCAVVLCLAKWVYYTTDPSHLITTIFLKYYCGLLLLLESGIPTWEK
jgi:hypothetical protein